MIDLSLFALALAVVVPLYLLVGAAVMGLMARFGVFPLPDGEPGFVTLLCAAWPVLLVAFALIGAFEVVHAATYGLAWLVVRWFAGRKNDE